MTSSTPLTANEALSGIFGSVSLSAWTFLLLPQLYENYTTHSANGISLLFLLIWALGDLFNLLGALWARLVPTVIALAFYFTISDSVLILQCLYYNHWVNHGMVDKETGAFAGTPGQLPADGLEQEQDEGRPLLNRRESALSAASVGLPGSHLGRQRSGSGTAVFDPDKTWRPSLQATLVNAGAIVGVCILGTVGWLIAYKVEAWVPAPPEVPGDGNEERTPFGAELLGYLSAALYLGARVPQIYKNWQDKSCEGLSLLFFMLSLLGNLTYGAGILCHSLERRYVLTNVPWLLGSLGTMAEDVMIFIQFHIYRSSPKDARGQIPF